MQIEEIKIDSYTVNIACDQYAENPFESWDCEPPLLAYYDSGRHGFKAYNDAPADWYNVLRLLPDSIWQRGQRVSFLRRSMPAGYCFRDFAVDRRRVGDVEALANILVEVLGEHPAGWQTAQNWLETAAAILEYGGIPCHCTQSNGYSQGDSTLLLAVGLPAWVEKVGAPAESVPAQLVNACELHGQWQWGDVYGVASIEDENGEEIPHGSCWGFYGSDHEKSGLLDHARNAIECHERHNARQAAHFTAALCPAE